MSRNKPVLDKDNPSKAALLPAHNHENGKPAVTKSYGAISSSCRHKDQIKLSSWHTKCKPALGIALVVLAVYITFDMLGFRKLLVATIGGLFASFSKEMALVKGQQVQQPKFELVPFRFTPLPLGSIQPRGWLEAQLRLMADGQAGRQHEFYRYVRESPWLGGREEYSQLGEAFPYWLNAIVPLAYSIGDERLKGQIKETVGYILKHQAEDGWLGPETVESGTRNLWGRYPVLLAFTQLLEADRSHEGTVLPALRKYVDLAHKMLKDGGKGLLPQPEDALSEQDHGWARIRVADMMVSIQWLYEHDLDGKQQDKLLEIMALLRKGALDWAEWYTEQNYVFGDANFVDESFLEKWFPYEHGVNIAMGLKMGAVVNRFEHNDTMVGVARRAVDWTFRYHGAASGTILADERIQGLLPYYGAELCTTVETMYSLSYLYQAIGDNDFADRAELAAFNALPAAVLGDWWAHQYVTQPNQPYSKLMEEPTPFWNVNGRGTTFGLEPDYPCCTVNHPQGYPKFVSNSWASVGNDGIAHVLLSPSKVSLTLGSGAKISVDAVTNYPFADSFQYNLDASKAFTLYVRIPAWSKSASWTYATGSSTSGTNEAHPDTTTGLLQLSIEAGKSTATIILRRSIYTVPRANNSVAVMHGPLLYTLDVGYHATSDRPRLFNNNNEYVPGNVPEQCKDWTITNTSAWNVAIDTSTLTIKHSNNISEEELNGVSLPEQIWSPNAPPTYIEVQGCEVEWPLYRGCPGVVPSKRKCLGDRKTYRLVPVGSTKIGMTELPTL